MQRSFGTRPSVRLVIGLSGLVACVGAAWAASAVDPLAQGFAQPGREARLRAYWWWLNGNVTQASITRDLEEMAAKGFGGALICDAGGAEQDGNDRVPHGPDFFSDAWRDLYKHALREADRLGLEMSLNIQSGWNLGGPVVPAEDAPKKLVWSQTRVPGGATIERKLAEPPHPPAFYRDLFVLAYPVRQPPADSSGAARLSASSAQPDHPAAHAVDGDPATFWVSTGAQPGKGPTSAHPEWLQLDFDSPTPIASVRLTPRAGYGPREGEVLVSDDGQTWRPVKRFTAEDGKAIGLPLESVETTHVRITFSGAYDPSHPNAPRNVQVAEVQLFDASGPLNVAGGSTRRPIENLDKKALRKALSFSAPDTSSLLVDVPAREGEEDTLARDVVDLTDRMAADGTLRWDAPGGDWEVLRFGCTLNDHCRVSTCSDGWQGYALDPFDAGAFERYWQKVVEPLIADAGPLAGRTLKYLHTDSWEVEVANWTPTLREEFRTRRGYDLVPYLPVVAGSIVDGREVSNRFLNDLRRTMGDLAVDNHYRHFADWAHRHGLLIHPESGGPHAVPVDAQRCLGMNDAPMSEFWARSWRHRVGDPNRFFVKQPASAAHTYGHRFVLAEGFTTIGPHWQETLWDNLKPSFDKAACEGLNRLVWHAFICSPAEMGLPGQEYFAGTHFNPNATWWSRSAPFLAYINLCQHMLQQGLFVADACYYYGDHVPNFAQLKSSDPARVLPGYDYDVVTEEVILTRMSVGQPCGTGFQPVDSEGGHGRLMLPDGMSYRVLVLPDRPNISPAVLETLRELVEAGATVIGPKPERATGLGGYPECDAQIRQTAAAMWGDADSRTATEHRFGKGRVISGKTARDALQDDGVPPDFEYRPAGDSPVLDYIHRRDGETDIYFVANTTAEFQDVRCTFRVSGKQPEIWDPVTGRTWLAAVWSYADGNAASDGKAAIAARTSLRLEFTPYGSLFVVFRKPAEPPARPRPGERGPRANFPQLTKVHDLAGPWTVNFDPKWGGPKSVQFAELESWTSRPEPGIRFYSGTATYRTTFDWPEALRTGNGERDSGTGDRGAGLVLDLGQVKNLAEVRLNGHDLGVLWAFPFRVEVSEPLKAAGNVLEIDVVNFWPNRVIGDASLPPEQRLTRTNIRKLTADTPLVESGLLGPVMLLRELATD